MSSRCRTRFAVLSGHFVRGSQGHILWNRPSCRRDKHPARIPVSLLSSGPRKFHRGPRFSSRRPYSLRLQASFRKQARSPEVHRQSCSASPFQSLLTSFRWRVYTRCATNSWVSAGLGRASLPEFLLAVTHPATAQGDDGVGAPDGPVHSGALESLSNDRFTARLDDARPDE